MEEILTTNRAATNSRFAKAGVLCFYDSEVLHSSFVHLMKFSAKNPRLRKAAKRWQTLSLKRVKTQDLINEKHYNSNFYNFIICLL